MTVCTLCYRGCQPLVQPSASSREGVCEGCVRGVLGVERGVKVVWEGCGKGVRRVYEGCVRVV